MKLRILALAVVAMFQMVATAGQDEKTLIGTTIDLRKLSDVMGEHEISFCVRPSPNTIKNLPGHAFVSFSVLPRNKQRTFLSIGHTVQPNTSLASAIWSYFGAPISGYLSEENYTSVRQACLVAKVDRADYHKALSLTKNPLESIGISSPSAPVLQMYNLGSEDCVEFMINVANVLKPNGLKVPSRGTFELPMQFMQRFISSNQNN